MRLIIRKNSAGKLVGDYDHAVPYAHEFWISAKDVVDIYGENDLRFIIESFASRYWKFFFLDWIDNEPFFVVCRPAIYTIYRSENNKGEMKA